MIVSRTSFWYTEKKEVQDNEKEDLCEIIASITAVIAFVQFSGLGQYIRENSIGVSCEDGTCAMKLRDRMMEEK